MTFVKFMFALLILVPVAILMWYLINKLINEFTDSVKESRERERAREKALKDMERKRSADEIRHKDRRPSPYPGYSREAHYDERPERFKEHDHGDDGRRLPDEKEQGSSGLKHMMGKRKRRKERRKKKDKEQQI